jgi:hypothetical protein
MGGGENVRKRISRAGGEVKREDIVRGRYPSLSGSKRRKNVRG